MDRPFVFGVGMPHTGSTRLAVALRARGYKVREGGVWNEKAAVAFLDHGDEHILRDCTWGKHNAWVGWPVVAHQKLVRIYPDAQFVVTVTNPDKWLERWQEFQAWVRENPLQPGTSAALFNHHLYGSDQPSSGSAVNAYSRQTDAMTAYLENHKIKYLVLDFDGRKIERALTRAFGPVVEAEPAE